MSCESWVGEEQFAPGVVVLVVLCFLCCALFYLFSLFSLFCLSLSLCCMAFMQASLFSLSRQSQFRSQSRPCKNTALQKYNSANDNGKGIPTWGIPCPPFHHFHQLHSPSSREATLLRVWIPMSTRRLCCAVQTGIALFIFYSVSVYVEVMRAFSLCLSLSLGVPQHFLVRQGGGSLLLKSAELSKLSELSEIPRFLTTHPFPQNSLVSSKLTRFLKTTPFP